MCFGVKIQRPNEPKNNGGVHEFTYKVAFYDLKEKFLHFASVETLIHKVKISFDVFNSFMLL